MSTKVLGFRVPIRVQYGFKSNAEGQTTRRFDMLQVVKKNKQYVDFNKRLPKDGIGIAFIGNDDLNAEKHLSIVDKSKIVSLNKRQEISTYQLEDDYGNSSLGVIKMYHSITTLSNGNLLIAGGFKKGPESTCFEFDPSNFSLTQVGSLNTARYLHGATLLDNGKVLVSGGLISESISATIDKITNTCELYDPTTKTWSYTGSMIRKRGAHTSNKLGVGSNSGQVLVTQGTVYDSGYHTECELYNPLSGIWNYTTALTDAENSSPFSATLYGESRIVYKTRKGINLTNGNIVVTVDTSGYWKIRHYNSTTGVWSNVGSVGYGGYNVQYAPCGITALNDSKFAYCYQDDNTMGRHFCVVRSASTIFGTIDFTTEDYPRSYAELIQLDSDRILLYGGYSGYESWGSYELFGTVINTSTLSVIEPTINTIVGISNELKKVQSNANNLNTKNYIVNIGGGKVDDEGNVTNFEQNIIFHDICLESLSINKLTTARKEFCLEVLPDGKVLAIGGTNGSGSLTSCELYDPWTKSWSATDDLNLRRDRFASVLMKNGNVLVVGGLTSSVPEQNTDTCEIYDTDLNIWKNTGSLNHHCRRNALTELPNREVLSSGGYHINLDASATDACEIYNPDTETWRVAGKLNRPRLRHQAVLLFDGNVLVMGGSSTDPLDTCELYDYTTDTWTTADTLSVTRDDARAVVLQDGKVLITGGKDIDSNYLSSCELYDPDTDTWVATGSMNYARRLHGIVLLPSGKVLVTGGETTGLVPLSSCELYDPVLEAWVEIPSLSYARYSLSSRLLTTGKVLVVGGEGVTYSDNCELIETSDSLELSNYLAPYVPTVYVSNSKELLITNKFLNNEYISKNALYYVHKIPADEAPTDTTSIKILDYKFQELDTNSYKIETVYDYGVSGGLPERGETLPVISLIDYIAVYNNYQNDYNYELNTLKPYYVSYPVPNTDYTIDKPKVVLLSNEQVFTEAEDHEKHYFFPHFWRQKYTIYQNLNEFGLYSYILPNQYDNYSLLDRKYQKLKVLLPAAYDMEAHWYPRITNNTLVITSNSTSNGNSYIFDAPEFSNQHFNPEEPYKIVADEKAQIVNDSIISVECTPIVIEDFRTDVLIYDEDDETLLYALTTDAELDETAYTPDINWDSNNILGWDLELGLLQLGVTVKDYYNVYVTYHYEENTYELRELELNPLYNEEATDYIYVIYMKPHMIMNGGVYTTENNTKTVYYLKIEKDSKEIVYHSDPNLIVTNREFNTDGSLKTHGTLYSEFIKIYSIGNNQNTYGYLILAELSLANHIGVQKMTWIDIRQNGGGLKPERIEEAKTINPYVNFCAGVGLDAGLPYPGKSAIIVKLPYSILNTYGGNLNENEVEDIVYRHLAFGHYPVIRYYGIIPNVYLEDDSLDTVDAVKLYWDSEPSHTFNVYYAGPGETTFTKHNGSPISNSSPNSYSVTGLTTGRNYRFYVTAVDTSSQEWPKSKIIEVVPK